MGAGQGAGLENSHQGPLGGNCPAGSHGCRKRGLRWWQKEGDGGGVRSTGLPLPLPPLQAAGPDLAPPLPHPFSPQVPLPRSGHLDCQLQFVPSQHPFPSEAGVHMTLSLLLKPVALAGPEDKAQWPDGIFQSHLTQPLATPPPCPHPAPRHVGPRVSPPLGGLPSSPLGHSVARFPHCAGLGTFFP